MKDIEAALKGLDANYNSKFGPYPVIFFNVLSESRRDQLQNLTKAVIHWVDISRHYPPTLPDLPVFKDLTPTSFTLGEGCASVVWWLEYLHMIRFRLVSQWHEEIFTHFDYIAQMDIDAAIESAGVDVFSQIDSHNKTFGYYSCSPDLVTCIRGLYEETLHYTQENRIDWKDKATAIMPNAYWAPFFVFRTEWFRTNPAFLHYIDFIDSTGNIYKRRWGEQTVLVLALSLSLPYEQIFFTGGLRLMHYLQPWPPARKCTGTKAAPSCCDIST